MKALAPHSPLRRGLLVAGLVLAGVLSFELADSFSAAGQADLVMPVERDRSKLRNVDQKQNDTIVSRATGEDRLFQMDANPARLDSHVIRNPFGNLNLMAAAELEAVQNASNRLNKPTQYVKKSPPVIAPAPPPPPPPVVDAPPPAPTAPNLPFTVVGGIRGDQIANGQPVAFLRQNDEVMAVRPGDEINNTYRVEAITTDRIDLIYIPLKQRQTLPLKP